MAEKTKFDIVPESEAWKATFDTASAEGPLAVTVKGKTLVEHVFSGFDGKKMQIARTGCYRKAGVAVYENEARLALPDGTGIRQAIRLANSVARFTTDVMIKRGTVIHDSIQVGSFLLPGAWESVLLIDQKGQTETRSLQDAQPIEFTDAWPMVLVFSGPQGRVEADMGFDLWRWNAAFGQTKRTLRIANTPAGVRVERRLLDAADSGEAGVAPEVRDFRFCHILAWEDVDAKTPKDPAEVAKVDVSAGKVDVASLGNAPALRINVSELPVADGMKVEGKKGNALCWEGRGIAPAKAIIRQLAAFTSGTLVIDGLVPSFCTCGRHVDRPHGKNLHWDLNGLLCFGMWVRQTLGGGWTIRCGEIPAPWADLPSVKCLFNSNGFSNGK